VRERRLRLTFGHLAKRRRHRFIGEQRGAT
jgi:hypothetical protein